MRQALEVLRPRRTTESAMPKPEWTLLEAGAMVAVFDMPGYAGWAPIADGTLAIARALGDPSVRTDALVLFMHLLCSPRG